MVTCPSSFNLFLKTHFVLITFISFGIGKNSHVLFFSIWSSSSSINLIHNLSFISSTNLLGSIMDNSTRCLCSSKWILLLVSTPPSLFPIICYAGWFFYTMQLGFLGGTWTICLSFPLYSTSSFSSSYSTSSILSFSVSSCSSKLLLLYLFFLTPVSSIITLMFLSLRLKHLYSFLLFEYPRNNPSSTMDSNFPNFPSSLLM